MINHIKPCSFLVIGMNHIPWWLFGIGKWKHFVLCHGVFDPFIAWFYIHWTYFPPFCRILYPVLEPLLLFMVTDRKPVFDKNDSGPYKHSLKFRARPEKLFILIVWTITHNLLNSCTVIPAPVKKNYFTTCRQIRGIPLEIPLWFFLFCRNAQCNDTTDSRIQTPWNCFDHTTFAGCISSFKDNDYLQLICLNPFLELYKFNLLFHKKLFKLFPS